MHKPTQPPSVATWARTVLGGLLLTAGVAGAAPVTPVGPAWIATYENPARMNEGSDVVVDSTGNAYVVGRSVASPATELADLLIVKYNSAGRRLWARTYPVPGGLGPQVHAALDGDAAVVVTGTSDSDITNLDILVVKYDSTGNLKWDFSFNSVNNGNDVPSAITVDAFGDVLVAATGDSIGVFSTDALLFQLDASDGEVNWQDRIEGETTDSHTITDMVVDDASRFLYVTGRVTDQIEERDAGSYFTRAYAADRSVFWDATYDGPGQGSDSATGIALTPDRDVVVTGRSVGLDGSADFATIKYDTSDGEPLWVRRYNGPAAGNDEAIDVAVDPAGNVYVTGASLGTSTRVYDYATVAYNGQTGNQLWVARYDGPGAEDGVNGYFDLPTGIEVDATGNATVTGRVATGNRRFAVGTLQYDATGRRRWLHLYNGPGRNDSGAALALDTAGNVFVTGTSRISSLSDDSRSLLLKYLSTGRRSAAPPTLTFTENSRDRVVCRREMGSQVCEEATNRTFRIISAATMEDVDLTTFGPSTPFALNVGGFEFDATLAEDPRYRAGKTSAVFTETVNVEGRERKSLTVTLNWARGKLRVTAVGTALRSTGILAEDYVDQPTGRITDTVAGAVTLGTFNQVFNVNVTGRVTTRPAQQGAFTLSTVTLSGKHAAP